MNIVCFGDSVTRGISYVKGRLRIVRENYPALLEKALGPRVQVANQGVFNDNSDLLVARLEKDVLSHNPDCVLIGIGGNDCNFRWEEVALRPNDQHETIVPLPQYLDNLAHLAEKIRDAGAVPVFLNLIPLDPARYYRMLAEQYGSAIAHWIALCGGIKHWHGLYNRALQQLADSLGVFMIDVRTAFKKAEDLELLLSEDGIHPTVQGYHVLSQTVAGNLQGVFPSLQFARC
jgi:lysophospholipase L1-like esterase